VVSNPSEAEVRVMNNADEISQAERRLIMADERRGRTYNGHALDDELDLGGRFAKVNTTTVVGAGPVSYPQQPQGSPWHSDACPPEPALGFSVDEIEPVGEVHEVRQSQEEGNRGSVARPKWRRF
jgi:hypothetical protein